LTAAGMDVYLLGPMPTPGVAYLTRTLMADLGVVISASHNPHHDNGIKFFSSVGAKLDDKTEAAIETYLNSEMEVVAPHLIGSVKRLDDAAGRYIEFCKASLPSFQRLSHLKVVIDCANGATYHIAPDVFRELGAEVIAIHSRPDGLNINLDCGSTHPESLADAVKGFQADIGVALDGDGDRIIMVDHLGQVIDGDQVLYILAMMGRDKGLLNGGGVVGTLMSNLGLEVALKKAGIQFARSKVGDRYVMAMLREKNWQLGGESSGHIIWLNSTTTGDGIVAALQVLMIMQETGKKLPELLADLSLYPQTMINIVLAEKLTDMQNQKIDAEVKKMESMLGERGRVLVRPSGTEPLVRVMVESENTKEVECLAHELAEFVREIIKK
jgi:phosphoglucosamine mutase